MVVDRRFSILTGSHSLKQVFYVSFVSKRVREEGGDACLTLWSWGGAFIRGRALTVAWALIQGNAVCKI